MTGGGCNVQCRPDVRLTSKQAVGVTLPPQGFTMDDNTGAVRMDDNTGAVTMDEN